METFSYPISNLKIPSDLNASKSWSRSTKRKHVSISGHSKHGPYTLNSSEKERKKTHTRQSSVIKKSKSKCDTEINYTSKKKSVEN